MRKITIIGTIHGGFTPNEELKDVLEKYRPHQLFVEIAEEDVAKNKLKDYPPEMVFAMNWAKENKIKVNCFDITENSLKKGVTKKEIKNLNKDADELIKRNKFTWMDLNEEGKQKIFDTPAYLNAVDWKKEKARELKMLANIKKAMRKSGTIVIVTGAGHLKFFEKHLKGAEFPFR
jgi:hypothetical protein